MDDRPRRALHAPPQQTVSEPGEQQEQSPPAVRVVKVDRAHLRTHVRLLATIFAAFLIEGIAEPGVWELSILSVLLGATLLMSLHVADVRSSVVRAAAYLVIAVVIFTLVQAIVGDIDERLVRATNAIVVSLAPPILILGVIRRIRATQTVPVDALIGVLCVYLLLGLFYASLYGSIDHLGGDQFFAQHVSATIANCTYYSFTTLATVGYGDLTAASNLGHTLSVSEALVGQVYLVTVVSLIIGNLGRRRS